MIFTADDISSKGSSEIFQILESNQELQPLSIKIKDFLGKTCISDLEPLENVLIDKQKAVVDNIADKWKDNGYRKKDQTKQDFSDIANNISGRW